MGNSIRYDETAKKDAHGARTHTHMLRRRSCCCLMYEWKKMAHKQQQQKKLQSKIKCRSREMGARAQISHPITKCSN